MTEERSLDEIDRWSEKVVQEIESLTPEQLIEYFKQAQSRLEEQTGKRLNLPVDPARHTPAA